MAFSKNLSGRRAKYRLLLKAVFSIMLGAGFFLMLEGLCSTAVVIHGMMTEMPLAELLHTEYDPELGWINKADVLVEDMYGTDRHLRTNSQRFRNQHAFDSRTPPRKIRVICSGDSFTLGYGVGDEQTWCAQLEQIDERLQTVNMGQGGYGIDQAYLWYNSIKDDLEHQIHLFTFISEDFRRAAHTSFSGYGKPVLEPTDEGFVVTNVPVPKTSYALSRLIRNGQALRQLDSVRLTRRLFFGKEIVPTTDESAELSKRIAIGIFRQLEEHHRHRGSLLILVHLPTQADYVGQRSHWRKFMQQEQAERGWRYLDLGDALSRLTRREMKSLFLNKEDLEYLGAEGHYNEKGNRFVAETIHQYLMSLPQVKKVINSIATNQPH